MRRKREARKLLVASIGVASVTYAACTTGETGIIGNSMAPEPPEAGYSHDAPAIGSDATLQFDIGVVGNLMDSAGIPVPEAGADVATDGPVDAGTDASVDAVADTGADATDEGG